MLRRAMRLLIPHPLNRTAFALRGKRRLYAEKLMHQQLFAIGRDIHSKHGNLLIAHGCDREESPYQAIPSLYTFKLSRKRRIALRGFGIFFGDDCLGGIFVHRYQFEVRCMPRAILLPVPWLPSEVPATHTPRSAAEKSAAAELLVGMVQWFCDYESWIQTRFGRRLRAGQLVRFRMTGNKICEWNMLQGWETILEWLQSE